jgi:hypothetical protein
MSQVAVGIAPDYGLDDQSLIPGTGKGYFFRPLRQDGLSGPQTSFPVGTTDPFFEGKARPGRDADHSHIPLVPRSGMSRSYTSCPHKLLRGVSQCSFALFMFVL